MKFGDFLFPESRDPERDGTVIDETLREARLAETLGIDAIWLGEHHFDGICAYVDPISFAAALAMATTRASIGFAVAQTSLHHPVRLAEQLALIDHLSKGRLIAGLGRGTAYNIYDYQGYGIDHEEAQARFEESLEIIDKAWSRDGFEHQGRFWRLKVPQLRPRPYTAPHPTVIRSASTEASMLEIARGGRPFLMNVQSNAVTRQRIALYRQTLAEAGFDAATVARNLADCWVWRNVFVAESDAEARRIGPAAFEAMAEQRTAMRRRVYAEQGLRIVAEAAGGPAPAHGNVTQGLICGSPETVAAAFAEIDDIGVGGVIMQFRLGPMSHDVAARSLELFMREVAPKFGGAMAQAK